MNIESKTLKVSCLCKEKPIEAPREYYKGWDRDEYDSRLTKPE